MISIIVPARNNADFTATCLASILFAVGRLNLQCEFVLIDDASAPEDNVLALSASIASTRPAMKRKSSALGNTSIIPACSRSGSISLRAM